MGSLWGVNKLIKISRYPFRVSNSTTVFFASSQPGSAFNRKNVFPLEHIHPEKSKEYCRIVSRCKYGGKIQIPIKGR